ncbi:MAG: glycosyltransferase family 9 protein [Deltaproteobacteria bacterium]
MNWKIEGLKKLDSVIGGIASRVATTLISPRAASQLPPGAVKILVIRPGGIGDAALLYPALRALRAHFAAARIDVLAERRNSGILRGCPYLDNLIAYDSNPLSTLLRVINQGYDIAIDTEQWHRLSALIAYLTKAPARVGFATSERAALFTHPVAYSQGEYEAQSFLNLASAVTGTKYDFDTARPFIPLDAAAVSRARSGLARLRQNRRIAGIFYGATVPERRWGVAKFKELAERLIASGARVAVLGGRDELRDSAQFGGMFLSGDAADFVGKTSLAETAALIAELDLLVTGDTGLLHIACGVGTPTVSLFGAGIEAKWSPRGQNHIAINKNLACSPCTKFGYTPKCPFSVQCLSDIGVAQVAEAAMRLLDMKN